MTNQSSEDRRPFDLSIGSIALEGFTHTSRHLCETAFAEEFHRLITLHGIPASPRCTDLQIPPLSIPAGATDSPRRVGQSLAEALYNALKRETERP